MGELNDLKTFLGKVHTVATVKDITEYRSIWNIPDTQRMLVYSGEFVSQHNTFYKKRFKVQISETSEANLTTALNNIINGTNDVNKRIPIEGYTKPSTLVYINFAAQGQAQENPIMKIWNIDIFLDATWVTN